MDEKNIFAKIQKVCLKNFVIVLPRTMIETFLNFYMVFYNLGFNVELKKCLLLKYFQNYLKKTNRRQKRSATQKGGGKSYSGSKSWTGCSGQTESARKLKF